MVRNILAVIAGIIIGSVVNGGLINIGPLVIPPPEGADLSSMEALKESMPLFEAKHFVFPFLAHAVGTFVGALIAAMIAVSHKMKFALAIGVFFLLGGIYMVVLLSAPLWFEASDLILAYIPMAWLGAKAAGVKSST